MVEWYGGAPRGRRKRKKNNNNDMNNGRNRKVSANVKCSRVLIPSIQEDLIGNKDISNKLNQKPLLHTVYEYR